jgi:hypothetical protein
VFGLDAVMWASDFPHTDSTLPGLATQMLEREDLTDVQRDAAMRTASASFFRLDEGRIARSHAERSHVPARLSV